LFEVIVFIPASDVVLSPSHQLTNVG